MAQAIPMVFRVDFAPFVVAVVAIIASTIYYTIKALITHRERMAMIHAGMNPDAVQKSDEVESTPVKKPTAYTEWSKPAV